MSLEGHRVSVAIFGKENMSERIKFRLLDDIPLDCDNNDLFDYKSISLTLKKVVENATPPYTIGIYGRWGMGKTSICVGLERELKADKEKFDKEYLWFYFDAWKYERDSFRRQFLIELDSEVFDRNLGYERILNQSLSIPEFVDRVEKTADADSFRMNKELFLIFVAIFLVIGLFSIGTSNITVLSIAGIIAFVTLIINFLSFTNKTISFSKTDSAEGFEHYYLTALRRPELKGKKLLIIIDNLDRLEDCKSVELLGDIKTFLADNSNKDNKSIFLLPCDNFSMVTHLSKIYGEGFDSQEYLRKIFTTTLRIPKLTNLEISDYISNKLMGTEVEDFQDNPNLNFVIKNAFRENPREIIQFINSLTITYILAKTRQPEIFTKESIAFLAKIKVISQKWPEQYESIESKLLRTSTPFDVIVGNMSLPGKDGIDEFKDFIDSVAIIKYENESVFFTLHQSKQERTLKEWSAFLGAIEAVDPELINSTFALIYKESNHKVLDKLLTDYIEKNKLSQATMINVLTSLSKIQCVDSVPKLLPKAIKELYNLIDGEDLILGAISNLEVSKVVNDDVQNMFLEKFAEKLLHMSIQRNGPGTDLKIPFNDGKKILSATLDSVKLVKKFADKITNLRVELTNFIAVGPLVAQPSEGEVSDEWKNKLNFMTEIGPFNETTVGASVSKIAEMIATTEKEEIVWAGFQAIEGLIARIKVIEGHTPFAIDSLVNSTQKYFETADENQKDLLIKIVKICLPGDTQNEFRRKIIDIIKNYISNPNEERAEKMLQSLSKEELYSLIDQEPEVRDTVIATATQSQNIALLKSYQLEKVLSEDETTNICFGLISAPSILIRLLDYLKYKIPDNRRAELIERMIGELTSARIVEIPAWISAIFKLGVKSYLDRYQQLIEYLEGLKVTDNAAMLDILEANKKYFTSKEARILKEPVPVVVDI